MLQSSTNDCENGIVFLALARNCAKYLPAFFTFLEKLSAEGIPVAAVVGENGSTDDTLSLLKSAQAQARNVTCLDTSFIEAIPNAQRTRRLGEARAALARYASERFPRARYICVIDVDNVLLKMPSPKTFLASAEKIHARSDIFGVASVSHPYYYDMAALRSNTFFTKNVIPLIAENKRNILRYYSFMQENVYQVQRAFTASDIRLCESAFNGLCIYNPADYYSGSYVDPSMPDVCEHVILNLGIHRSTGRRILVDDSLAVAMPEEHGPQSLPYFVSSRALKLAQRGLQRLRR
jgi:glycosyltransferase involved in cell wall biosynthesis